MSSFKVLIKIVVFSLVLVWLPVLTACDAGSNSPVATDLSAGNGYNIALAPSIETVKTGGTSTLTVVIFEPDGSPIRDGEKVYFASYLKGSFSDDSVETSGGTAVVTYTASENIGLDTVTATCHGAISSCQIIVSSF